MQLTTDTQASQDCARQIRQALLDYAIELQDDEEMHLSHGGISDLLQEILEDVSYSGLGDL